MKAPKNTPAAAPSPLRRVFAAALSLAAGVAVALLLDYLLYRMGLPSKPFIYVSF